MSLSACVTKSSGQCLISPFLAYDVVRRSGGFNLELKVVSFHWPFLNGRSVGEVSEGGRERGFYLPIVTSGGVSDRKLGAGHPDDKPTLPRLAPGPLRWFLVFPELSPRTSHSGDRTGRTAVRTGWSGSVPRPWSWAGWVRCVASCPPSAQFLLRVTRGPRGCLGPPSAPASTRRRPRTGCPRSAAVCLAELPDRVGPVPEEPLAAGLPCGAGCVSPGLDRVAESRLPGGGWSGGSEGEGAL